VGRHAAGNGASAHPLVAAALERGAPHGSRRHGADGDPEGAGAERGDLGWPGPSPGGGGLGWPADDSAETAPPIDAAPPAEEPAPAVRRRGWRRLFGSRAA
jgi:hypothetical protein